VNLTELVTQSRLEGVYGVLRKVQSEHDQFETRCIGSGNCCKIGLVIPLAESWNIAKNIRRQYWLIAEDKGKDEAEVWYQDLLARLTAAMHDDSWSLETNEQDGYCAFYSNGCSIYEFRPMVCRAYGVIAPVQEGVCPRKRLPDGGHELIWDATVEKVMSEFNNVITDWGSKNPTLNFSMYMPAGVLRFLLSQEELQDLIQKTDQKFWMGHEGYQHQIDRKNWNEQSVEIGVKNDSTGAN
jgi:Fe-S-cluster containining protein